MKDLANKCRFLNLVLTNFNVKSNGYYKNDITTFELSKFGTATSLFDLCQIKYETTHVLNNTSCCIDLIFTFQVNLEMPFGVDPSIHPNCHHQLVFSKFNFKSSPIWIINLALSPFQNWSYQTNYLLIWLGKIRFSPYVNKQVPPFNETIRNDFDNFIPHETVAYDDNDPTWMTKQIRATRKQINKHFRGISRWTLQAPPSEKLKGLQMKVLLINHGNFKN